MNGTSPIPRYRVTVLTSHDTTVPARPSRPVWGYESSVISHIAPRTVAATPTRMRAKAELITMR